MSAGLCSGVGQVHTWVAIADRLKASSNAQEGAIPLGTGVVQVSPPLALYPASEQELCEEKRACTAQGLLHPLCITMTRECQAHDTADQYKKA